MPVWRLQCSIGADTAFQRDRLVITPHFNDGGVGTDPDALCGDLADALNGWVNGPREIVVKAYDAQGAVPVYPQGEAIRNPGAVPQTPYPREVALCLSFYNERNVGRRRGRLYIPWGITGHGMDVRPTAAHRQKVADLVPFFTGLGGPDVDWVVYSRADNVARPVTNWYVDNEWDTIRSRGLRADLRLEGTTSEA